MLAAIRRLGSGCFYLAIYVCRRNRDIAKALLVIDADMTSEGMPLL